MTERHASRLLSESDARRAIYIDFEGEKDKPPVLLGVHRRGERPWLHLLDPTFAALGGPVYTLHDSIANVVRRAERHDRRIVAWSIHERDIVRAYLEDDPDLVARFEARLTNGKLLAERWRNRCRGGDKPASGKLADYLALIGCAVPADAVGGAVGDTIRSLRRSREGGRELTATQAERWRRLVEHNRHDCEGLRRLSVLAATELDQGCDRS